MVERMKLPTWMRSRPARVAFFLSAALLCGSAGALLVLKYRSPQGLLVDLKSSQIGVRFDAWSGERALVTTPGYHLLLPGLQQIALFERSPLELVIASGPAQGPVPAGPTTVRSSDGSKFWFEALSLQHQLRPEQALAALDAFGGDARRQEQLIALIARAALARVYGEPAAHEVADPAVTDAKKLDCRERLRAGLEPFGVELIQLAMPKPRFEREYEKAIEERQLAAQAQDKIETELAGLVSARPLRLKKVERELVLNEKVLAKHAIEKRLQSEAQEIERRSKADTWALTRRAEGAAKADELGAFAQARRETALAQAAGLRAEVEALAGAGELAVREEIIKRLASIEFTLSPFLKDPAALAKGGN
jgi:SPFH domain / Band 7 family